MLIHFCKECRPDRVLSYGAVCSCGAWLCNEHVAEHAKGHEPPLYWRRRQETERPANEEEAHE